MVYLFKSISKLLSLMFLNILKKKIRNNWIIILELTESGPSTVFLLAIAFKQSSTGLFPNYMPFYHNIQVLLKCNTCTKIRLRNNKQKTITHQMFKYIDRFIVLLKVTVEFKCSKHNAFKLTSYVYLFVYVCSAFLLRFLDNF